MADQFLAKGAGQVAATKGSGNLAASRAGAGVGAFLADNLGKMIQKRNNEFNKLMEAEMEAAGDLTDEEKKEQIKRLKKKRGGYVLMNRRGMISAEKELLDEAKAIETDPTPDINETIIDKVPDPAPCDCLKQDTEKRTEGDKTVFDVDPRTVHALENSPDDVEYMEDGTPYIPSYQQAWDNVDRNGEPLGEPRFTESADGKTKTSKYGHIYPNTPEGQAIFRAHSEADWQAAGGQVLDFTDEKTLQETWYKSSTHKELQNKDIRDTESWAQGNDKVTLSGDEYKKLVNKFAIDEGSQQKINTVVQSVTADANAFTGGDATKEFNYEAVKNNVMNNIINSKDANLKSLAEHNIWGGTSWKDDMTEALEKGSYEDLGITKEQAESEDPTPKTPITAEDAVVITKAIMSDEKLLKETLGNYYTKIAENNYNAQAGNNNKKNNTEDNEDEFN